MKRLSLCIALILTVICIFAQQRGMKPVQVTLEGTTTTLYQQSHALLIGVSDYNMGLPPLPGVVGDINRVQAALEKNGFEVTKVLNPDAAGLQRAFNKFISQYGQSADNRLLIYFAGHGYTKKMSYGEDIGYICPVDAPNPLKDPAAFQEKAMPMGQIEIYAKQIASKHALFLFDACFSGSIFSTSRAIPEIISYKTTQPVRQFITSGSADETVPDKSIFQSQFIRALNGEADANKDGFLTGTELGDFLQSTVVNYSYGSQHPQYGKIRNPNLDKGDFVFVLNASTQKEIQVVPAEVPAMPANKPIAVREAPITGANVVSKVNVKQETKPEESGEIFTIVEQEPQFPGGNDSQMKFIQSNIIYPTEAKNSGIQGTVFVTFIVEKDGSLTNISVIRGIGGGCDEEAIRLIKLMPKWEPGIQRNKQVRVQYNLPIRFKR